jgi:pyrimidine operon attenuation protein/uracil phosphoribosyltransferase
MAVSSITFIHGETVDVEGDLQAVIDALHDVASRRLHSFAVLVDSGGEEIAVRPEAVAHVRPLS